MPSRFLDELPPSVERERLGPRRGPTTAPRGRWRRGTTFRPCSTGDSVRHGTLGEGVVTGIEPGGVVTVRFAGRQRAPPHARLRPAGEGRGVVAIDVRSPGEDELRAAMKAGSIAFGDELKDEDFERHSKTMPTDRFLAAYDGDTPVAHHRRLSLPADDSRRGAGRGRRDLGRRDAQPPAAGRAHADDADAARRSPRVEASPSRSSGRPRRRSTGDSATGSPLRRQTSTPSAARFGWRDDPGPEGVVRIIERDEARETSRRCTTGSAVTRPGFVTRDDVWWDNYRLADPEQWRRGAGPKFFALLELDGEPAGYAMYRIKQGWEHGFATSELRVVRRIRDLTAGNAGALAIPVRDRPRRAGRMARVDPALAAIPDGHGRPQRAVACVRRRVAAARRRRRRASGSRRYATGDAVVAEVRDEFCPWNAGRWRMGRDAGRTDDAAELELDVADLASAYLGAFDFHRLATAERVRELAPGAVARAAALFRTERPPYCPEDF